MIKQNDLSQNLYLLKNTRALNLKRYRFIPRIKEEDAAYSFDGLSSNSFSNKWFLIGKRQSIFKTYDDPLYPEVRKERILNEMLCYRLATKLGINAAPCQPAKYDEHDGLISYSFLKDGDKMISGTNILQVFNLLIARGTFENFAIALPEYATKNGVLLDDEIELDLFKMMVFDFLTIQEDRHLGNIIFIQDKNGNLKLAPLFDNEFAFAIVERMGTGENFDLIKAFYSSTRPRPSEVKKTVTNEAYDLFKISERDDRFKDFLKEVISFDVEKFFKELDSEISIDEDYITHCKKCFEYGQEALKTACKGIELADSGIEGDEERDI